jgi:hypothetical protein
MIYLERTMDEQVDVMQPVRALDENFMGALIFYFWTVKACYLHAAPHKLLEVPPPSLYLGRLGSVNVRGRHFFH